jgi:Tol biopolymer transport system component
VFAPGGGILLWSGAWTGKGNAYVVASDGHRIQEFFIATIRHCPHLLADGRTVDYWSDDSTLRQVAVGGPESTARTIASFSGMVVPSDRWSPDGRWIAFRDTVRDGPVSGISIVKALDGAATRIADSDRGRIVQVEWSPSSDRLAFARQVGTVIEVDTIDRDGTNLRHVTQLTYDTGSSGYPELIWSKDATRIGIGTPMFGALSVFTGDGQPANADDEPAFDIIVRNGVWWASPDGARVAKLSFGQLVISDASGVVLTRQTLGAPSQGLVWSPDSSALLVSRVSTGDSMSFDLYAAAADRPPQRIGPYPGSFSDPLCLSWLGS